VIEAGEEIWREDPFVVAPEWYSTNTFVNLLHLTLTQRELWDAQRASVACAFCTTPLVPPTPLHKECTKSASGCPARFCSLICRNRSQVVHPILCPGQNKAIVPFFTWVRKYEWMAPHALAHCISRVILAHEKGEDRSEFKECKNFLGSLAEMSLEKRCENVG
jgi:hypothetical protein